MTEKRQLILPRSSNTREYIEITQSLLLIGANGSGKTRLGTWIEIESPQRKSVHRISAQKSLSMPDSTTPVSIELAEKNLLFGNEQWTYENKMNKWESKPATTPQNDYQKLMVYLFSDETEANAQFKVTYKASTTRIDPPVTKIDILKKTWEKILPHRELIIGGLRVQTRVKDQINKIYNSSEMSDGERVIFYLIGQCLAAPNNGIIVIDEPELHLHKSVQAPLWAEIERLRSDCLFVYLTHDVDFAAAQEGAQRIWLKSYDGDSWDWELVRKADELPNELLIELLGSRKPVVFVEGDNGSHDVSLYRLVLTNFLVIPRGSCSQVIQSVKALRANTQLHRLNVYGLIDRDRRPQIEIDALERDNIFCLDVAEVENLFCTREILSIVSTQLARDPSTDLNTVVKFVFKQLQSELDTQVSLRVAAEIKHQLNIFDASAKGQTALTSALKNLYQSIDVAALYIRFDTELKSIVETQDYDALLKVYNRKSLASQACAALGLKQGELAELVIRLARTDRVDAISTAVKRYVGRFSSIVT
ncbi:DUF4435 domain-containing protein [Glaciimonas sp. GG7]